MYVWTHPQNQFIRPGFGQATPATTSPVEALIEALKVKFGVQFNSLQGQSCVLDHVMGTFDRRSDPVMYERARAAATQYAAIRRWTLDELRFVESACELYCRLGLLPSKTMAINISRLGSWPVRGDANRTWISEHIGTLAKTKCGACTGSDPSCSTGKAEIMILDSAMSSTLTTKEKFGTIVHELAHALLVGRFWQQFSAWPRHPLLTGGKKVSSFGAEEQGVWKEEDIADSVAFYLTDPGKLRKISKDRFEFLKKELQLSRKCR